jgi:hypothetical protein
LVSIKFEKEDTLSNLGELSSFFVLIKRVLSLFYKYTT